MRKQFLVTLLSVVFFAVISESALGNVSVFQQSYNAVLANTVQQMQSSYYQSQSDADGVQSLAMLTCAIDGIFVLNESCAGQGATINVNACTNCGTTAPVTFQYKYNGSWQTSQPIYPADGFDDYYLSGLPAGTYTNASMTDANGCTVSLPGTYTLLGADNSCDDLNGCGCGAEELVNGGLESNSIQQYSYNIEGNPAEDLANGSIKVNGWAPYLPANAPFMYHIDDTQGSVNNPEGDYFAYLPTTNECFAQTGMLLNDGSLEEGGVYTLCFYAAAWSINLDANGYPNGTAAN